MASIRKTSRSGFSGVTKLRKTLRRLEPESVKKIKVAFNNGAEAIQFDAMSNAMGEGLIDSGDMISSISIKYARDGLTAVVGPGADVIKVNKSPFNTNLYVSAKSKWHAAQFFKAYWAEFGTKGDPSRNIPPQRATYFMAKAYDMNKRRIRRDIDHAVDVTLTNLARGDGSDKP